MGRTWCAEPTEDPTRAGEQSGHGVDHTLDVDPALCGVVTEGEPSGAQLAAPGAGWSACRAPVDSR